jgi:glycosyltransferase involved in cell wall biosynthesis
MKVLYVNPSGGLGGAERVLLNIIDQLKIDNPENQICLLLLENGELANQVELENIEIILLPLPPNLLQLGDSKLNHLQSNIFPTILSLLYALLSLPNYILSLRKIIKQIKPDLIHSNGFKSHFLLGLANYSIPTIWHVHDFVSSRRLAKIILKWIYRKNITAIANSKAVDEDLHTILPKLSVQTVYNSINVNKFSPGFTDKNYLESLSNLPASSDRTLKIGLVATFAKWKGHELFMQAAARLIQELQSPLRFYIIGGAIYKTAGSQFSLEELTNRRSELKLENHLGFIGFQSDTVSIYRSLDIVVHASTQPEPFGMTIIEAMSCGKPVIVSNAGGAAEIIDSGNDAIGFQLGNLEELIQAIKYLIENPSQREMLGQNARKTVLNKFDTSRLSEQILAIYTNLISPVQLPSKNP